MRAAGVQQDELRRKVCWQLSCLLKRIQTQAVPIQSIDLSWDPAASVGALFCVRPKNNNAMILLALV